MLRTLEDYEREKSYLHQSMLASRKIMRSASEALTKDNTELAYYLIETEQNNIKLLMLELMKLAKWKKDYDSK